MTPYLIEWLNLIVRFTHVITGIAWIGASFYFIWLDNHLEMPPQWKKDKGIKGDLWAIHGGGFYEVAKYEIAPEKLPQTLHWFKWEAYSTWLSGMLLLSIIYYLGAESYLIDTRVADLSQAQAIGLGVVTIFGGWVIYELLCNSKMEKHGLALGLLLLVLVTALSYALFQVFSARGAYIHIGALIGTIMAGNVFRVIMPSQRALVTAVSNNEAPDPRWGIKAKLRSTHNTFATLPLIFIMISNHYPMTYNHSYGWLTLLALFVITAVVRWYFVLRHSGKPSNWIPVAVVLATALLIYSLSPSTKHDSTASSTTPEISASQVSDIITTHCTSCHSANPSDTIFTVAPGAVILDDYRDMLKWRQRIKARAVDSQDMPLMNNTNMTQSERDTLANWVDQQAR